MPRNGNRRCRCRSNSAQIRQPRPDSSHGVQVKVLKPFKVFPLRSRAALLNASHLLTDYPKVDTLGFRYKSVNFSARRRGLEGMPRTGKGPCRSRCCTAQPACPGVGFGFRIQGSGSKSPMRRVCDAQKNGAERRRCTVPLDLRSRERHFVSLLPGDESTETIPSQSVALPQSGELAIL